MVTDLDTKYTLGSTVLDACYLGLRSVYITNTELNGWLGTIETYDPDDEDVVSTPMVCTANCESDGPWPYLTDKIFVDGDSSGTSAPLGGNVQCHNGAIGNECLLKVFNEDMTLPVSLVLCHGSPEMMLLFCFCFHFPSLNLTQRLPSILTALIR